MTEQREQFTRMFCAFSIYIVTTKGSKNSKHIKDVFNSFVIALLLCLSCAPANNFSRRDRNALSCGFYSKFSWKRFLLLDFCSFTIEHMRCRAASVTLSSQGTKQVFNCLSLKRVSETVSRSSQQCNMRCKLFTQIPLQNAKGFVLHHKYLCNSTPPFRVVTTFHKWCTRLQREIV